MNKEIAFFNGVQVSRDKNGNVSLTDLWRANGGIDTKTPNKWQKTDVAQAFIRATEKFLKGIPGSFILSKKGKGGGTFAHPQIALEYAQYLSPELAVMVNQVFFERIEEEKNPELILDRAIATYKKKGKSDEWITERLTGKATRKAFTDTLAKHGVKGVGYRDCTNAIYDKMFGGDAEQTREKKNLPVSANLREYMTEAELAATRLTELIAKENIEKHNLKGNKACEYECLRTSHWISKSLKDARKTLNF
jgi:hypothetical protein